MSNGAELDFSKPVRIYELSRALSVSNKELIAWLRERGYDVKSHSSTLDPDNAREAKLEWTNSLREQAAEPEEDPAEEETETAESKPTEEETETAESKPTEEPTAEMKPEEKTEAAAPEEKTEAASASSSARRTASRSRRTSARRAPEDSDDSDDSDRSGGDSPRVAYSSRQQGRGPASRTYHSRVGQRHAGRSISDLRSAELTPSARPPSARVSSSGRAIRFPSRKRTGGASSSTSSARKKPAAATPAPAPPQPERAPEQSAPPPVEESSRAQRRRKEKERERIREERMQEQFELEISEEKMESTSSRKETGGADAVAARSEPIEVQDGTTIGQLAEMLGIKVSVIVGELFKDGIMATINHALNMDLLEKLEERFQFVASRKQSVEEQLIEKGVIDSKKDEEPMDDLEPRAPIVTIMGHVDHGKTTLLDRIRRSNVAAREAGSITQHIGAYDVHLEKSRIVFLDTPGHQAFTAMRARGAKATDIVVLVVAADDGVMPQTIEVINHAKAAETRIVVAVNKMDLASANIDLVKEGLSRNGLMPEDWGGDTVCVPVSAEMGDGIDELLEVISLEAELLELTANPDRRAVGVIIESELNRGRGAVATVLVQNGTLKMGDYFVAGSASGRVRALISDQGKRILEAGPSTPVEALGFDSVPTPGDQFLTLTEEDARALAGERKQERREQRLSLKAKLRLEDLASQIQQGMTKDLNIILKTDVEGSISPLQSSLSQFNTEEARVTVIHAAVGDVSESDVMLASASQAVILGFNVRAANESKQAAEREGVDIRLYSIIYDIVNDVKASLEGLLEPTIEERIIGRATVRQVFEVSRLGLAAGSYVNAGEIVLGSKMRVMRGEQVVHEGSVDSLRRFRENVQKVTSGYECGIATNGFSGYEEGDVLICFTHEEVSRTLSAVSAADSQNRSGG